MAEQGRKKYMNNSLVTVVVTAYNIDKYIEECVKSILSQRYSDLEILIIDDGSSDRTSQICQQMTDLDSRIQYVYQENAGVSVARNNGIERAQGKYICFVDGDDFLPEDAISSLVNEIDKLTDIVIGDYVTFDMGETKEEVFFTNSFVADDFQKKKKLFIQLMDGRYGRPASSNSTAVGVPWGKLYRLNFILDNQLRFNPKLTRMQDNNFNMYAFEKASCVKYIHKCCYAYRIAHVKSFGYSTPLNVWRLLIEERNEFSRKHKLLWDRDLINAKQYEENIALISSVGYLISKNDKKTAINEMKSLRSDALYSEIYDHSFSVYPRKFFPIRFLMKTKLFGLLYLIFKTLFLGQ